MFRRHPWLPIVIISLGVMGGFLLSAIVTYVMPKKYESKAIVQVVTQNGTSIGPSALVEREMATISQVFTNREVMARVVESLELTQRWNLDPNACIQILEAIVQIESIRGTDLISIRCRHTNKVDTRDIANGVATAAKDYRTQAEQKLRASGLNEIGKAVREQEDKVEESRKILNAATLNQKDITDAKREYETSAALLEQLKLKQISETITAKIAGESVQIHKEALIGEFPISPRVTYNLVFGTAAGFLAGILITFLIALIPNTKG